MNRVLPAQIQCFPVIGFQLVPIVAVNAPLHLEREFFAHYSEENPEAFVQII